MMTSLTEKLQKPCHTKLARCRNFRYTTSRLSGGIPGTDLRHSKKKVRNYEDHISCISVGSWQADCFAMQPSVQQGKWCCSCCDLAASENCEHTIFILRGDEASSRELGLVRWVFVAQTHGPVQQSHAQLSNQSRGQLGPQVQCMVVTISVKPPDRYERAG